MAVGVLSGNRNFEGRVHPNTRANYLASPPLVIAYAIAGTIRIDFEKEPLGKTALGCFFSAYELNSLELSTSETFVLRKCSKVQRTSGRQIMQFLRVRAARSQYDGERIMLRLGFPLITLGHIFGYIWVTVFHEPT